MGRQARANSMGLGGPVLNQVLLVVVLAFEAGLLFVAANTGFLGGPAVEHGGRLLGAAQIPRPVISAAIATLCLVVRRHYRETKEAIHSVDEVFENQPFGPVTGSVEPNTEDQTAVFIDFFDR